MEELAQRPNSDSGGQCVEVAHLEVAHLDGGHVGVRDSKTGPALVFTAGEWDAFLGGSCGGELNRP
ncbi:DUF397 domain-containing protein [Nocardia callitridis]|uniref:DUF397 domain-containing protein n=1 Tax=Nocardia callitridis TaxID=648753 RepID=UPI0031E64B42